jgi:hypothetical protein
MAGQPRRMMRVRVCQGSTWQCRMGQDSAGQAAQGSADEMDKKGATMTK